MTIFDTIQSSYLSWITLLLFIQPDLVAKLSQDEVGVNTPPKDGNPTGMADLYTV